MHLLKYREMSGIVSFVPGQTPDNGVTCGEVQREPSMVKEVGD